MEQSLYEWVSVLFTPAMCNPVTGFILVQLSTGGGNVPRAIGTLIATMLDLIDKQLVC